MPQLTSGFTPSQDMLIIELSFHLKIFHDFWILLLWTQLSSKLKNTFKGPLDWGAKMQFNVTDVFQYGNSICVSYRIHRTYWFLRYEERNFRGCNRFPRSWTSLDAWNWPVSHVRDFHRVVHLEEDSATIWRSGDYKHKSLWRPFFNITEQSQKTTWETQTYIKRLLYEIQCFLLC